MCYKIDEFVFISCSMKNIPKHSHTYVGQTSRHLRTYASELLGISSCIYI